MWAGSLHQEDPLEEGRATRSSTLAWRIPWAEEPGRLQSIVLHRVGHDWSNSMHAHTPSWGGIGTGRDSHISSQSVSQFICSVMSDSATPWTAARQASLSITNSRSLLKLMSIELVMPCNHLILYCPLLLLPLIFPSIRVFSNESVLCIRWPKY